MSLIVLIYRNFEVIDDGVFNLEKIGYRDVGM